jgi:hypothetical protein
MTKEQLQQKYDKKIEDLKNEFNKDLKNVESIYSISLKSKYILKDGFKLPAYLVCHTNFCNVLFYNGIKDKSPLNFFYNEKLYAQLKLQYIADQLNDGWKPNWNDIQESKYFIFYENEFKTYKIYAFILHDYFNVYFKLEELAEKALKIMGEDINYLKDKL